MKYVTTIGERSYQVEVLDEHHVSLDGTVYEVDFTTIGNQPVFSLIINGRSLEAHAVPRGEDWNVLLHGRMFEARVEDEQAIRARALALPAPAESGDYHLRAPMPGLVADIPVQTGQIVDRETPLVILESMKMQNELRSLKEGKILEIRVQPGQVVEQNQVLVVIG